MKQKRYLYKNEITGEFKEVDPEIIARVSPRTNWIEIPEGAEFFVLWEGEKNTFYKDKFNLVTTEGNSFWENCWWKGENNIKENGGKLVWCEEVFEGLFEEKLTQKEIDEAVNESLLDECYQINQTTTNLKDFKVGDPVVIIEHNDTEDLGFELGAIGVVRSVRKSFVDTYHIKIKGVEGIYKDGCIAFQDRHLKPFGCELEDLKHPESQLKSVGVDISEYAHLNTEGTKKTEKKPIKSDGGSSDYYKREIPELMLNRWKKEGVIEAKDVMKLFLGNDYNFSNSFKAHCRVQSLREGVGKEGVDEKYDLRKAWFFSEDAYNDYLERG